MAAKRGVDAIDEQAEGYSSGGIFAKLENHGDTIVVAFVGAIQRGLKGDEAELVSEEYVWIDGQGEEYDPVKHAGEDPKLRIKWNIYDRKQEKVRIWSGSVAFFRDWKKLIARKGLGHWFEIERDGAAKSKKTKYRIYDIEALDKETLADLKALELNDLEKPIGEEEEDEPRRKQRAKSKSTKSNGASERSGPMSASDAAEIRDALKGMPDAAKALSMFKDHFKVEKIKDLPAEKVDEAGLFIAQLTKTETPAPAEAPAEEIDPFE